MRCWGLTDKGSVRQENQDSFLAETICAADGNEVTICVVCDGIGGAKAGNVASDIASRTFLKIVKDGIINGEPVRELTERAVYQANELVYEKAYENAEYGGMGTTLVAAVVVSNNATIVNVGDSRCYLVNESGIVQITKDHSLVEDMIDRGEILREEAWRHPSKNLITRALGTDLVTRCDIFTLELGEKDCLLLCTDGLSNIVNPQELLFELVYGGEIETAVTRMMDIALGRSASDNVTVVVIAK